MKVLGNIPTKRLWIYHIAIGIVCALAAFGLYVPFDNIPAFVGKLLMCPAAALGPTLGLFLGWPAIIGCTAGTLAAESLNGYEPITLALRTLVYFVCNMLPFLLWYTIKRKSDRPYPRFDSTANTVLMIMLLVGDALVLTLLMAPVETNVTTAMDINETRFLSTVLFLVYVGLPLLIGIERIGLQPLPPHFIRIPYERNLKMNLTQRIVTYLLIVPLVILSVFLVIGSSSLTLNEEDMGQSFADNTAALYGMFFLFTIVLLTPMLFAIYHLEKKLTRPAEVLTKASKDFVALVAAHRNDPGEILVANKVDPAGTKPRYEMAELFDTTNAMRFDLVRYIGELEATAAERERVATELSIASRIQADAVPTDFGALRDQYHVDVEAVLKPARKVGGDFYDAFGMPNGRVGLVMADVSDKGMPAALFMMRAMAEIREKMRSCDDVGQALTKANQALCERNDTMLFVTVFACTLDVHTGALTYANAGHNPPWIERAGVGSWMQMEKPQLVMGALAIMRYQSHQLYLTPGDSLVLYTDGVTEAANANGALFGTDQLQRVLEKSAGMPPKETVEQVLSHIDSFVGNAPQADDITVLSAAWDLPSITLEVEPDLASLQDVLDFALPLLEGDGRTDKMAFDVRLALEEAFVNIARYGFPDGVERKPVHLTAAVDEGAKRLFVRIADAGVPYDPLAYKPQRVDAQRGADNKVGGLGILLVRSIADTLVYERADGMNVLRFAKDFV